MLFSLWNMYLPNWYQCVIFMLKITNHEEVISHSLATEETKNKVVNFLSKV